jgi:hypothetical protein
MPTVSRMDKREAAIQLRKKLVFEAKLYKKLRKFLKTQSKDIIETFYETGVLPNASFYGSELEQLLMVHHREASEWYGSRQLKQVRKAIKASNNSGIDTRNAIISAAILLMIRQSVADDLEYMANDTNVEVNKALDNNDDKKAILALLASRAVTRADRHATNINQRNIEGTKQVIAERTPAAISFSAAVTVAVRLKKTWVAIVDKVTRSWHVSANGQTVDVDKPFEVNGEILMYPGDFSLGATAKNLERCRCTSIHTTSVAK